MTDRLARPNTAGSVFEAPAGERSREARQRAVDLLYAAEMRGCPVGEVIAGFAVPPDEMAVALATGVEADVKSLDKRLDDLLTDGWRAERLASCDRLIMRLGLFELRRGEAPVGAVINEAVELAHTLGSSAKTSALVNGVLGAEARSKNSEQTPNTMK